MKLIDPATLVDIQALADANGVDLRIDLIYADAGHPLNQTFKTAIYRPDARLWLHRDLAGIVLAAARRALQKGYRLVLADGLRPMEAQQRMTETPIVRVHPHWTAPGPGLLLSPPGRGAHPRGMAVDVMLETSSGDIVDMGTPLDYFSTDPADNPAARDYPHAPEISANRKLLDDCMMDAARAKSRALVPLASEWWDFRLPAEIYEQYAPLTDAELPPHMRMCS